MTPSEKKASNKEEAKEVMRKIAFALGNSPSGTKPFHVAPPILENALDEAERRGFERAKRMAMETVRFSSRCLKCDGLITPGYPENKYRPLNHEEVLESLKNLTFEDSHEEA